MLGLPLDIVLYGCIDFCLGHIHKVGHIGRFLIGLPQNLAGGGDEFALNALLLEDAAIVFDIGCRSHLERQFHQSRSASDSIEIALCLEFLGHGNDIETDVFRNQGGHSLENHLVCLGIETGRSELPHCFIHTVGLDKQGSEDRLFDIKSLRRDISHLKPQGVQIYV